MCYFSSPLGPAPPHIKAASFSLNVNIKSVDHKSQHSLHKLPLPQPLILPSDEGERGRGVTARGSDGGRERWRERDGDREREIQQKQLLASEIWHLPNAPSFWKCAAPASNKIWRRFRLNLAVLAEKKTNISDCRPRSFASLFCRCCFKWLVLIHNLVGICNRLKDEWESRVPVTELWHPIGERGSAMSSVSLLTVLHQFTLCSPFGNSPDLNVWADIFFLC